MLHAILCYTMLKRLLKLFQLSVKINADTEGVKAEFILSNYLCYAMQKMSVEILENSICITCIHTYTLDNMENWF